MESFAHAGGNVEAAGRGDADVDEDGELDVDHPGEDAGHSGADKDADQDKEPNCHVARHHQALA